MQERYFNGDELVFQAPNEDPQTGTVVAPLPGGDQFLVELREGVRRPVDDRNIIGPVEDVDLDELQTEAPAPTTN